MRPRRSGRRTAKLNAMYSWGVKMGREARQCSCCVWWGEQKRGAGRVRRWQSPTEPGCFSLPSSWHGRRLLLSGWLQHLQPAETCLSHWVCMFGSPFLPFHTAAGLSFILQALSVQLLLSPFILLFCSLLHSYPVPFNLSFFHTFSCYWALLFLHAPPSLGYCLPNSFLPLSFCCMVNFLYPFTLRHHSWLPMLQGNINYLSLK